MLVEDEQHKIQDIRRIIDQVLVDHELTIFDNVKHAVLAIYNGDFDLVVLDMHLPTFHTTGGPRDGTPQAVGGMEVIRAMKQNERKAPVIIVTQYPDILIDDERVSVSIVRDRIWRQYSVRVLAAIAYSYNAEEWEASFKAVLGCVR